MAHVIGSAASHDPVGGRRRSAWLAKTGLLKDLRQAVADLDFSLDFQPQFNLTTGCVSGFEALIRWQHPTKGIVPAQVFVPVAERAGLIGRIGQWALARACAEAAKWPADIGVAVNVAAAQIEPGLLGIVQTSLDQAGLPAHRLELEVTETELLPAGPAIIDTLHALRSAGVRIAIDDFGSGYASFNYLIDFPFDKLKIDGSLISTLGSTHSRAVVARTVVRSVSTLCQDLGVACVAEGVETQAQLKAIAEAGCTEVQGFLLAEPVAAVDIAGVLERGKPLAFVVPPLPPPIPAGISFLQVAQSASDIVVITNTVLDEPGPTILYVNPAFTRLTGFTAAEAVGKTPRILQGPGTSRSTLARIGAALRAGELVREKVLNYAKCGAPYWLDLRIFGLRDHDGVITHFAAIQRDVTMDKRRSDELEELADRDALTGIPNRRAFLQALEAEVLVARRQQLLAPKSAGLSLALIDVDDFKRVNDTYGHPTGDAVLCGLADRLAETIRRADVLARWGGEEFAVCMPHVPLARATGLAEQLRAAVEMEPFDTPAGPMSITVSVGVTEFTPACCEQDLLQRADSALYDAKRGGRNTVRHSAAVSC